VTRGSIRERTEALRGRYLRAARGEKGRILDQFTQVTGYHCKAAIRRLRRSSQPYPDKRRRRPRRYRAEVAMALRAAWQATDRLCARRLHPFVPELVRVLGRHVDRAFTAHIEAQLCRMSPCGTGPPRRRKLSPRFTPGCGRPHALLASQHPQGLGQQPHT